MFVRLGNTPLRYAWGARGEITRALGPDGAVVDPEYRDDAPPVQAELWLGAHHGSPSRILDPETAGGAVDLAEWLCADPRGALGAHAAAPADADSIESCPRLPFLLKVLSAGAPLSLQVHPTLERARAGFAAEQAAGIPIDAPHRNYRDPFHKPEVLIALSERMDALAGFASLQEMTMRVEGIMLAAADAGAAEGFAGFADRVIGLDGPEQLRDLVAWVLAGGPGVAAALPAVDAWIAALADVDERIAVADDAARPGLEQVARLRENVARIRVAHPDDTGVLTVLLMNHLRLERGEAAYVRAGVLHAYLDGLGIEVMAASDNVLRGGLTEKHVDVDELLAVLECEPGAEPRMDPVPAGEGVVLYAPDEPDFRLHRVAAERADARIALVGPGIALGLRGEATLVGALGEEAVLRRGEALYITPDTGELRVSGDGIDLVIASAGAPADVVLPH